MKRYLIGALIFSWIFLIGIPLAAYADSGRHPVSGTPRLKPQRQFLLRDYGPPSLAKAEKTVFADTVDQQITLYAYNFATDSYYVTTATCKSKTALASGYFLYIYVENSELTRAPSLFTTTLFSNISSEYSNNIVPKETTYFGSPRARDFTIVLLDIQDGGGGTYVSGYFDPINLTPGATNGNNRDMIYMDSKEGTAGSQSFYGTFAHEFNHYIHYLNDQNEATWVEEGMAGLARYVCGYGPQASHVNAFGAAPNTSLTVWGEGGLENYGATFLFMLYLEEHYGGAALTKAIIANGGIGAAGINAALLSKGYSEKVDDIFKNWVIANYLNNSSISNGLYGYQADFASYTAITAPPGKITVGNTVTSYPVTGNGTVHPYAADYVKFSGLTGTYNIFVLMTYSLATSGDKNYSYSARTGSLILNLTMDSSVGAEGAQQGTTNPTPSVVTNLSSSSTNTISTESGGSGGGGGGSSGGGGCFIATAAYGSPMAKEVSTLREFRDRYLLANAPGRAFVSVYYALSPSVARLIDNNEPLKNLTRAGLNPVVGLAQCALKYPLQAEVFGLGFFFLVGLVLMRRRNSA